MTSKQRLFKMILLCGGCAFLLFAFQRCTPITPSASKTLLHPPVAAQGNPVNGNTQDPSQDVSTTTGSLELNIKARLISSTYFSELSGLSKETKGVTEAASKNLPMDMISTLFLDESQLKSLREHHKTLVQLVHQPLRDVSIYIEIASAEESLKKENEEPLYAELQLKPVSGNVWRLTVAKTGLLSSSENNWILTNVQNVMIRFTRIQNKISLK